MSSWGIGGLWKVTSFQCQLPNCTRWVGGRFSHLGKGGFRLCVYFLAGIVRRSRQTAGLSAEGCVACPKVWAFSIASRKARKPTASREFSYVTTMLAGSNVWKASAMFEWRVPSFAASDCIDTSLSGAHTSEISSWSLGLTSQDV